MPRLLLLLFYFILPICLGTARTLPLTIVPTLRQTSIHTCPFTISFFFLSLHSPPTCLMRRHACPQPRRRRPPLFCSKLASRGVKAHDPEAGSFRTAFHERHRKRRYCNYHSLAELPPPSVR
ncbi:hypothetical protein BGZ63DRAFT_378653 [Mariannaea sp. PMI_226]|nr:hypothetical protein BGZ63DRAFT_378653 [Mariannaea sp. PMI_226]